MNGRIIKSKSISMSNWEMYGNLTEQQIQYAANDAWISRDVHCHVVEAIHQHRNGNKRVVERFLSPPPKKQLAIKSQQGLEPTVLQL
jgi:ribonuclease D